MTALTLPGDIEGLLRRGSPVRPVRNGWLHRGGRCDMEHAQTVVRGVLSNLPHVQADAVWLAPPVEKRSVYLCGWGNQHVIDTALDLTDATGRYHATLWLADNIKRIPDRATYGALVTGWYSDCPSDPECWHLDHDGVSWAFPVASVPGLDDTLDSTEALRLVCLHVAGREA